MYNSAQIEDRHTIFHFSCPPFHPRPITFLGPTFLDLIFNLLCIPAQASVHRSLSLSPNSKATRRSLPKRRGPRFLLPLPPSFPFKSFLARSWPVRLARRQVSSNGQVSYVWRHWSRQILGKNDSLLWASIFFLSSKFPPILIVYSVSRLYTREG